MLDFARMSTRQRARPSSKRTFEHMLPEIRRHVRSAVPSTDPRSLDESVACVAAIASDIFARLSERGLSDLAYPRPLAMAALVRLRQTSVQSGGY
jgi:hypothetical protein